MSESLLEALMQLFALLTDYQKEKLTGKAHMLVNDYLERQFNAQLAEKYLKLFDDYLKAYHGAEFLQEYDGSTKHKESSLNKISAICAKLNVEMEQAPKVLLFIQLVEFLKKEDEIGEAQNDMIDLLANQLKINPADYQNLKVFILGDPIQVPDKNALLVISGSKEHAKQGYKHIYHEKQQTIVWILRIKSTETFIYKYSGRRNLYMNGYYVEQDKICVFASGSVIKTSLMPPVYYGRIYEDFLERKDKTRIIYKAVDVEHKFNPKQIGVHQFSMIGRSGQLIGIIGGSGTGKSTLLNVLNGNLKLSNGQITINGYDLHEDKEHLQGVIGYVPQIDLLIEELTVYENLYYNARLCFSNLSETDIKKRVNAAIEDFDLVEAKDLIVGSPVKKILSGGQRKRLNIALELIRQPSILFVDEPTSGLSSMDSEKVMSLLKRQTLKGRLVIINIHQPSSDIYKLFDKLLIIDKGGRVIHNGNPMDAIVYFKQMAHYVNPEERECQTCGNVKTEQPLRIIEARKVTPDGRLIRERKITPQAWYKFYQINFEEKFKWKESIGHDKKEDLPPNLFSIPTRWEQFKIYLQRDALSKLKDKQYMLINFAEGPILALILGFFTKYISNTGGLGYIFSENVNLPSYIFMSIVVALFLGLNVSAEEIIKDTKLLQRERFLNLSRSGYLSAKIVILFTISAIQTLTFVLIGNGMLEIKGLTFSYWLILFSVACFANMLGLNLSSGLNSVVSIYISIPLALVPQMLFSGVIVEFDKLHSTISDEKYVPIIGDVMASRWGYEALAVNQFINNKYEKNFFTLEQEMSNSAYYSNLLIPELELRNNEALYAVQKGDIEGATYHLGIINNMLALKKKNISINDKHFFEVLKHPQVFNKAYHDQINQKLDSIAQIYKTTYTTNSHLLDNKYKSLIEQLGGDDKLLKLKQNYQNKALDNWLLAKQDPQQIAFNGKVYIQKKHPVFKKPEHPWGRAHFYAPYKLFAGLKISTPVFNTIVLWLMTLILFITLYFKVLRQIISYFERFKLRRLYQRLQKMST